jgi:predicted RNase H-like nuclease (RuvC/YqgF family)
MIPPKKKNKSRMGGFRQVINETKNANTDKNGAGVNESDLEALKLKKDQEINKLNAELEAAKEKNTELLKIAEKNKDTIAILKKEAEEDNETVSILKKEIEDLKTSVAKTPDNKTPVDSSTVTQSGDQITALSIKECAVLLRNITSLGDNEAKVVLTVLKHSDFLLDKKVALKRGDFFIEGVSQRYYGKTLTDLASKGYLEKVDGEKKKERLFCITSKILK